MRFEALPAVATEPYPRRNTFYVIFWITSGSGIHYIDLEALAIVPNTLYFIAPGQTTFWEHLHEVTGYTLLFTQDFLATNLLEHITLQSFEFYHHTQQQSYIHVDDQNAPTFTGLCEHMLDEYTGKNVGRFTMLQCLLPILLVHAQRHYTNLNVALGASAGERLLTRYLQLVDIHFRQEQNLQQYAGMLGITSGHLRDIARQHLGTTPIQLLNRRIILEAKRLLIHSDQTIAEIGLRLNFDDPSYFSRFFKRETKQTPSHFRETIREKYQHPRT